MSRIMCVATPKVKPARKTARPESHRFGAGLLATAPYYGTMPFTAADIEWAAAAFARDDEGVPVDLLAGEAAGFDAVTAGVFV